MESIKAVNKYLASLLELNRARELALNDAKENFKSIWESALVRSESLAILVNEFRATQAGEPIRIGVSNFKIEAYGKSLKLPRFRRVVKHFDGSLVKSASFNAIDMALTKERFSDLTFNFQRSNRGQSLWAEILKEAAYLEHYCIKWVNYKRAFESELLHFVTENSELQLIEHLKRIDAFFEEIVSIEESIDDQLFEFNFKMPSRYHSLKARWDERVPECQKRFGCKEVKFLVYTYFPRNSEKRIGVDVKTFKRKNLLDKEKSRVSPWITKKLISKGWLGKHKNFIVTSQSRIRKLLRERTILLSPVVSFIDNFSE